ncbi:neuroparsin-A [Anabrus simplex]|uniref:neuroparsin-A n=1 Tax=Anabrus simplex TaxID=316456 RepID=UPI0035A38554
MQLSTVLLLVTVSVAVLFIDGCSSSSLCPPCEGDSCDVESADCQHGVVKDYCGRKVCAKGPGQKCGGVFDILGKCGKGMSCKCERCAGCSLSTLDCYFSEYLCLPAN